MSKFTKFLSRPASVTADATVAIACGVFAYILIGMVKGMFFGLGDAIQPAAAAVVGAMVYMRARENLNDPAPAEYNKPG